MRKELVEGFLETLDDNDKEKYKNLVENYFNYNKDDNIKDNDNFLYKKPGIEAYTDGAPGSYVDKTNKRYMVIPRVCGLYDYHVYSFNDEKGNNTKHIISVYKHYKDEIDNMGTKIAVFGFTGSITIDSIKRIFVLLDIRILLFSAFLFDY